MVRGRAGALMSKPVATASFPQGFRPVFGPVSGPV